MSTETQFDVTHTGSFVDQRGIQATTYAATMDETAGDGYYVSTGVTISDERIEELNQEGQKLERFELILPGQQVQELSISSGPMLTGVKVTFGDGTTMQRGVVSGEGDKETMTSSIRLDERELVTWTAIDVLDVHGETMTGVVQLRTSYAQRFVALGWAAALAKKFLKSHVDRSKGKLLGVYGVGGDQGLLALGFVLSPPEDVEYRLLDVQYDLDGFECIGERMLSLKEQTVVNRSSATVSSQVKFSHSYSVNRHWSNKHGLKGGVKTKVDAKIPFLVKGEVEVSAEYSCEFNWGRSTTDAKTDEWTATITAPPHSRVRGRASITESTINIPYAADLQITREDGTVEIVKGTSGVYRGVNISDFRVEVDEAPE